MQDWAPGPYPVTVKLAGLPSAELALPGLTVPLVQVIETLTGAALSGTKSFTTWKVATALLSSVQLPAVSVAEQVPVEL